jgi:REP element-mobilizing transposase RayT
MGNHVHLIVGVPGDPDPSDILGDFKSYGSRALNRRWPKPVSGTWWTEGGSKRKLPDERALFAAIRYVQNQPNALVIWINEAVNFDPGERGV